MLGLVLRRVRDHHFRGEEQATKQRSNIAIGPKVLPHFCRVQGVVGEFFKSRGYGRLIVSATMLPPSV